MLLRPAFCNFRAAYIDELAVSQASHSAPALVALDDLFMAEEGTLPEVLQLVADLLGRLAYLPGLLIDRVPEVAVDLNDCLHDKLAFADDVESRWVLTYIIDCSALGEL